MASGFGDDSSPEAKRAITSLGNRSEGGFMVSLGTEVTVDQIIG